jgi:translation initiation factor 1
MNGSYHSLVDILFVVIRLIPFTHPFSFLPFLLTLLLLFLCVCIVCTTHSQSHKHTSIDPFIDAFEDAGDKNGGNSEEKVHVRVQQRNGRKCITTVAGLADDLDVKRICKAFKKNFSCNGAVQKDEDVGEVIQLSGDQRTNVKDFLVDQEICHSENIVLHGF